ncbi:hypothetical protein LPJ66_007499, partial [Kickxella alabastrina]
MKRNIKLLQELLHIINQVVSDLVEEDTGVKDEDRVGYCCTMSMSMANQNNLFKEQLYFKFMLDQ